jgi:hypothetical protein
MRLHRVGLAALVLGMNASLAAQTPTPGVATVRGTVVDSLHGTPLVGASVAVDGSPITGISDSLGRFRLDSVPAGTRQIAVYHPLLDSLGVALYTAPTPIAAGGETVIPLALPSRRTLMAQLCRGDSTAQVLVVGQLLDVDGDTPIANGTVTGSAQTASITVTTRNTVNFRRSPAVRTVQTDDAGRFHFCLPTGSHFVVAGSLGNSLTAEILLDLNSSLAMPVLRVSRADSATTQRNRGTLAGHVVTTDGQPIEGATVSIDEDVVSAKTARDGSFALAAAPSGTRMLAVRHVGYTESTMAVALSSTSTRTLTAVLQPKVTTLPTVDVAGHALAVAGVYQRTGFARRKETGFGHYLTDDDIAKHNAGNATTLLEGVPGVRLQYGRSGARVELYLIPGRRHLGAPRHERRRQPDAAAGQRDHRHRGLSSQRADRRLAAVQMSDRDHLDPGPVGRRPLAEC